MPKVITTNYYGNSLAGPGHYVKNFTVITNIKRVKNKSGRTTPSTTLSNLTPTFKSQQSRQQNFPLFYD
jgi:hypothetical protein